MLNKGKEKAQQRPSKKKSKIWNSFTEEQQPDGSKKAKCNNCGELLVGDSKKGTSHLWRHLKSVDCTEPPNKDARTTLLSYSSGNRENQLGYVQQTNTETFGCQDNNLGENHLGYVQQIHTEPSRNRENQLEYLQQTDTEPSGYQENNLGENHLEHVQQINTEPFPRENQLDFWSLTFLERGLIGRITEEIVAIGGARLTAEKMQCLIKPIDKDEINGWIPDEVINCYIGIMNNQGNTSAKILRLSTFDTPQLLKLWSMEKREELCEPIEKGYCFLQNELVFLPIQVQNHWFVIVLNVPKKEFQILDSSNSLGGPYEETIHRLKLAIQWCINAVLSSSPLAWRPQAWRPDLNVLNWPISVILNLPQQKDRCSSGLFALKYMQVWDGSNLSPKFTQDDIDLFRKQLVGELIFSELNERKNIQNEIKTRKISLEESDESEEDAELEEPQK